MLIEYVQYMLKKSFHLRFTILIFDVIYNFVWFNFISILFSNFHEKKTNFLSFYILNVPN